MCGDLFLRTGREAIYSWQSLYMRGWTELRETGDNGGGVVDRRRLPLSTPLIHVCVLGLPRARTSLSQGPWGCISSLIYIPILSCESTEDDTDSACPEPEEEGYYFILLYEALVGPHP